MVSKELLSEVLGVEARKYDEEVQILFYRDKYDSSVWAYYNIYELAFCTRDYFKTKNKHLSLNKSIEDIFKEADELMALENKEQS